MTMFERIVEEKQVIDPIVWLLRIQFTYVDEDHEQYVKAMAERWKLNKKIMNELQQYIDIWNIK